MLDWKKLTQLKSSVQKPGTGNCFTLVDFFFTETFTSVTATGLYRVRRTSLDSPT